MSKPAYLVVDARSSDPDKMVEYRRLSTLAVEKFGARFLVRGNPYEVLEGEWRPQRLVIIEFADHEQAKKFYDSPEYVACRKAREGISDFQMLLVESY